MIKKLRMTAGAALFGVAAALMAPSASAVIVTGSWDPALPAAFGNYGWTATVNVKVAENCGVGTPSTPTQPLTMVNFLGVSFGCNGNVLPVVAAFQILTAEVGIYDLSTNVILDVLRFNTGSFNASLAAQLVLGDEGEILFLQTATPSNVLRSALTYDRGCKYDFRLALPGANPQVRYRNDSGFGSACAGNPNSFTAATAPITATQFSVNPTSAQGDVIAATRLEVTQRVFGVPEPGSLLLAALALGLAGAVGARRTRAH